MCSSLLVDWTMQPEIWQGLCPGWTGLATAMEGEEEVEGERGLVWEGKS